MCDRERNDVVRKLFLSDRLELVQVFRETSDYRYEIRADRPMELAIRASIPWGEQLGKAGRKDLFPDRALQVVCKCLDPKAIPIAWAD
jgi:hypothetical protein